MARYIKGCTISNSKQLKTLVALITEHIDNLIFNKAIHPLARLKT